jgi:hypothetical protein
MRRPLAFAAILGCVTLPDCGAAAAPFFASGADPAPAMPALRSSWMRPDAKSMQLLYVSDVQNADVLVYEFPTLELAGTLSGSFQEPVGECVDAAGDVFIVDRELHEVLEYAHGGSKPLQTLDDANQDPLGCAIDPSSGDLAVTNYGTDLGGPGSVSIYRKARGSPATYSTSIIAHAYYDAYDSKGELYVDGLPSGSYEYAMAVFKNGTFKRFHLGRVSLPYVDGVIVTNGTQLTIGQQYGEGDNGSNSIIYRLSDSGEITGTTGLKGTSNCYLYSVVGNEAVCYYVATTSKVLIWKYPRGGKAIKAADISGTSDPFGTAVSIPAK